MPFHSCTRHNFNIAQYRVIGMYQNVYVVASDPLLLIIFPGRPGGITLTYMASIG